MPSGARRGRQPTDEELASALAELDVVTALGLVVVTHRASRGRRSDVPHWQLVLAERWLQEHNIPLPTAAPRAWRQAALEVSSAQAEETSPASPRGAAPGQGWAARGHGGDRGRHAAVTAVQRAARSSLSRLCGSSSRTEAEPATSSTARPTAAPPARAKPSRQLERSPPSRRPAPVKEEEPEDDAPFLRPTAKASGGRGRPTEAAPEAWPKRARPVADEAAPPMRGPRLGPRLGLNIDLQGQRPSAAKSATAVRPRGSVASRLSVELR